VGAHSDQSITAENLEKSHHTDFNEYMTDESASVACSNVRLWKLDSQNNNNNNDRLTAFDPGQPG